MKRDVVTGKPVLRIRVVLPSGYAVGPGKADLLSAIERLGSIAAAGRSMNMSYQRAWSLVDDLNRTFPRAASRGGSWRRTSRRSYPDGNGPQGTGALSRHRGRSYPTLPVGAKGHRETELTRERAIS